MGLSPSELSISRCGMLDSKAGGRSMAASATGKADSRMSSRGDLSLPRSMVNLLRLIEKMMAVDQIGVTEVARRLEMPVATAFRLLKVLEHCGYAEQVPDSKQYRLTLKLFEIGCHVASRGTIRDLAAVEMDRLARQTGLAVNLGVLAGGDVLYIHKVQADDEKLILDLPPGTRVPAHCTAMGKAMLAFARGSLRELVGEGPYDQLTEHSISTYEQLERELEEVRRAGYAVDRQELHVGIWCVAAPVLDGKDNVLGAISVSALRTNVERQELDHLGLQVLATVRHIASRADPFSGSMR
jgi:IclR family acetate operon transcriptional repressor